MACKTATAFTHHDAAWLEKHQHRKILDPRVRITGVAARSEDDGHPLVLICYPLRTTATELRESSKKGRHAVVGSSGQKEDTRGGSVRKWKADQPVPWPNHLWLVDPQLTLRAGRLEHMGWVQDYQNEIAYNEELAAGLAAAHAQYAAMRWDALSDDDQAYCERMGYAEVLRDTGVGGLRFATQVKCLHAHLAHALSGANNPIGRRVVEALARGADAMAGKEVAGVEPDGSPPCLNATTMHAITNDGATAVSAADRVGAADKTTGSIAMRQRKFMLAAAAAAAACALVVVFLAGRQRKAR